MVHGELDDNVFCWVILNKRLKLFPLTRFGFAKLSELRRLRDRTLKLHDVVDLVESGFPRVLVKR